MPFQSRPLEDRIAEKIDFTSSTDGCWLWQNPRPHGYGQIRVGKRQRIAHRVIYELYVGPVDDGLELDHLCRNRSCVNPDHLEPVTHSENVRRGEVPQLQLRKTHCLRGHPFDEENTRIYRGSRGCRKCAALHAKRYRREKTLAACGLS